MKDRKTILVGLDFFPSSIAAMVEAIRIREWSDARLIAAHVIDERLWHQLAEQFHLSHELVTQRAEGRLRNEIVEIAHSPDHIESAVIVGHPVKELLNACHNYQADLLVLGARGMKEDESPELGNVSGRLLRQAPIDVLIVRKSQTHPFKKVVACVDFSDQTDTVLEKAIDIAEEDEARLEIVHVMPHLHEPPRSRSPLEALGFYEIQLEMLPQVELIAKARKDLDALLARHRHLIHRARVHMHVVSNDDATQGLLEFANESNTELLVLGKQGHSRLKDVMLGATAEKIANQARVSVMAVSGKESP